MMTRRARCLCRLPFALLAAATACGATDEPIRIGGAGWNSSTSTAPHDNLFGIQIAIDEANAAGGVHGRQLVLVPADDHGLGTGGVRVAGQFVDDRSIVAVVGHQISQAMLAAVPVYDGKLAAVGTTTTSTALTGLSSWAFRVAHSDDALGAQLAGFAVAQGWRRIAILYENDDYGRTLASSVESAAKKLGGQVVAKDPFIHGDEDLAVFVKTYVELKPDIVVVICTDGSALALIRTAAALRLRSHIIGADGWTAALALNREAEGIFIPSAFLPDDERVAAQHYRVAFRRRHGRDPDAISALGYDAARVVIAAIERGGASRRAVHEALADKNFAIEGATGPIRFERGDRVGGGGGLVQVRNGKLHTYLRWADTP
ncbi:MAG: ABC transporter substrate-binding protein [bacterium]